MNYKKPTLFSFAIYFTGCVIGVGSVNSSAVGEKQAYFGDAVMWWLLATAHVSAGVKAIPR